MGSLVYKFGLLDPTFNADLVDEQMRLAHRYRNILVEIEHERRATYLEVMAAHPDVGPLEQQLQDLVAQRDEVREQILKARAQTRSRSEDPDLRARAKDLGAQATALRVRVKAARKAVADDATVRRRLDESNEYARQRVRDERGRCDVYWGTYLLQEADSDRARLEKTPPKFRRWTGEGRVSVQLQGGLEIDDLWGSDTQLRIDPVSPDAHNPLQARGVRRRAQRTLLHLRVNSDRQKKPIWAKWPMILHRPLPVGAVVKTATVSRRRRNCQMWRWSVELTLSVPDSSMRPAPDSGVLAMNLGYCQRPGGDIRAGYIVGDDGYQQEILVTKRVIEDVGKSESIRGFRDTNMDLMRTWLVGWRQTVYARHEEIVQEISTARPESTGFERLVEYIKQAPIPGWLAARIHHVHSWKSAERFRQLAERWRDNRFPGDERIHPIMSAWYKREVHLECYESGRRDHALLRRREQYRCLAAKMAVKYRSLVIDDTDLRVFMKSPAPESTRVDMVPMKRNQRLAAGSELRNVFINAFGGRVSKQSARDKTRRCYSCGHVDDWDRLEYGRGHRCTGCGASWDQDANFCRNLLREHACDNLLDKEAPKKPAEKAPSRSERFRAAKGTKAA